MSTLPPPRPGKPADRPAWDALHAEPPDTSGYAYTWARVRAADVPAFNSVGLPVELAEETS